MHRWLAQGNDKAALDNYLLDRTRHTQFVDLLLKYRTRLETLYASPLPDDARDGVGTTPGTGEVDRVGNTRPSPRREQAVEERMRAAKARDFEALRAEYALLREHWGGYKGYDIWFTQDLNNAHLPRSASITSTSRHSRRYWQVCTVICLRSIGWRAP